MAAPLSVRIAVVGDTHDDWDLDEDRKALQSLQPDLVLFTGDFGNENVGLVRSVANLDMAKAVILGNHDAWNTQKFSSSYNGWMEFVSCSWCFREKDPVQLQLECLGDTHVGYQRIDFPNLKLSVIGGRPFSCGGDNFYRKKLLMARYGVRDMEESAKKIYTAASGTPEGHCSVFLAHNGPTGLGSNVNDICGRDWFSDGGDHGDPDLARAISELKETTKLPVPLVVFGHMHNHLYHGKGLRKMIVAAGDGDTVYLNGAIVPRVRSLKYEQTATHNQDPIHRERGTLRAFTIAELLNGKVEKVSEFWVSVIGDEIKLVDEKIMFSTNFSTSNENVLSSM